MQQTTHPIVKDLVLVGGGHPQAIALRLFGMKPIAGLRLTLITEASPTPYSGMLPGHVAGFYNFDECHIDLRRLAQFAQVQLYIDQAVGLDLENKKVLCANHPPVAFDILSLDIGSTPAHINVRGASKYAIAAKPVPQFLNHWNQLIEEVTQNPQQPIHLGIVGGGAGGVELALTMQRRLEQIFKNPQQPSENPQKPPLQIHLFHRDAELMLSHSASVRRRLLDTLIGRGIQVHLQESVSEVLPGKIQCKSGLVVECDHIFWVTQASAPDWIRDSGLSTDSKGFVLVNNSLQSISHPDIFAAGDIATMVNHPRPKAGVFAVRQGKPLFENLQRILLGKPLKSYTPQTLYLSLIGTGDKSAIASWGRFGWQSPLLWRWKDYIDRQFMNRFSDLPDMSGFTPLTKEGTKLKVPLNQGDLGGIDIGITTKEKARVKASDNQPAADKIMRCSGCGSKVGSTTLERVLQRLQQQTANQVERDDILIGLSTPDDAAVLQVPSGQVMVQTIDYFRSLINDPYTFGQISTNHCLSDIFAMGATPQSALAVVTVPYAVEEKIEETLYQLLSGAMNVLAKAETALIGGHTTEGAELAFGLTCNGLAAPDQLLRKGGMKPGQVLILTKALGTGTLFAADMRLQAKGRWIDEAVHSMLLSNQEAARTFVEHGATSCTDITGFGLLGHLLEMVKASSVFVELDLEAIPVLAGALEMMQQGITSSLQPQNLRASKYISNLSQVSLSPKYPILFDPQTSGGLLATVAAQQAASCVATLKTQGYVHSRVIGRVLSTTEGGQPIDIA